MKFKEGEAFRAANARTEGVTVLPSGLQFRVLQSGRGRQSPKVTDCVKLHFRRTFVDGRPVNSSGDSRRPIVVRLAAVMPGWMEGLQIMREGDKFQLVIPPHLGDPLSKFGRHCTLIYEVELLQIVTETDYMQFIAASRPSDVLDADDFPDVPTQGREASRQRTFYSLEAFEQAERLLRFQEQQTIFPQQRGGESYEELRKEALKEAAESQRIFEAEQGYRYLPR